MAQKYHFTNDLDLSDPQIEETIQTYLQFAENYARLVERVSDAKERIQSLNIDPLLKKYKELKHSLPILFVGAGSGRDLQTTETQGIPSIGIDISPEMVRLAKSFGVTSPYYVMDMRETNFPSHSLAGIFCETAISHIKKAEQQEVLHRFYNLLIPNGILFLGVRIADGHVYFMDDEVGGRRFNTTSSKEAAEKIINKAGFHILSSPRVKIADRPDMVHYTLQKQQ